jgi:hypothetical protein
MASAMIMKIWTAGPKHGSRHSNGHATAREDIAAGVDAQPDHSSRWSYRMAI